MDNKSDSNRLSIIASLYKSDTVVYQSDGTGQQMILKKDPRRFYIRFRSNTGAGFLHPYPGKIPSGASTIVVDNGMQDYKFHDCPGIVTGEWYVNSTDPLETIEILTDTYIGR